ncbi:WAT1-related protein [Acorus gramineus]|uniref:WAT1-related protein n=1 Tax=Acorus gramineus TaxID=55184 RepID=A0AAV9AS61_ACOGR|nr:WAT1-related protein [Acorus gramineus]
MGVGVVRRNPRDLVPYVAMVAAQAIAATYAILSKIIFAGGTNSTVFIFYQFLAATAFMAPLALITERKTRPSLTPQILGWMFLLAFIGATMFQLLLSGSLYYISTTTQSAILNLLPAFTYVLSIASRQENADLNRLIGVVKLLGTAVSVSGALTLVLWHGSADHVRLSLNGTAFSDGWFGSLLAALGIISFSTWLILQGPVTHQYPSELSITAMMYFFGAIQTGLFAAFTCHRPSDWILGWNLELLNIIFGGVVNSGIGSFIFVWCDRKKGPLFVAVFSPLMLLLTAVMEMAFLNSPLHLGSAVGAVMIVGGLYLFLWAKSNEESEESVGLGKNDEEAASAPLLLSTPPVEDP